MIAKTPVPLRWSEKAEAAQVCTLALLEREPQSATARPIDVAPPIARSGLWPALPTRLAEWFRLVKIGNNMGR